MAAIFSETTTLKLKMNVNSNQLNDTVGGNANINVNVNVVGYNLAGGLDVSANANAMLGRFSAGNCVGAENWGVYNQATGIFNVEGCWNVSCTTCFEGEKSIEGYNWLETQLQKDQIKYLCNDPTAKGTNPLTCVDTHKSLMYPD